MANKDDRLVFGYAPNSASADLVLGIPAKCWERIKDGHTTTLDLTRVGIPIRVIVFGCTNWDEGKRLIEQHNAKQGVATLDLSREDMGWHQK